MARKDNQPDSYDLMPEALDFLVGRGRKTRKREVAEHLTKYMADKGMGHRERSIGWSLNRLCRAGLVLHPRHGYWAASKEGIAKNRLSLAEAKRIMEQCTEQETRNRENRKR